MINGFYNKYEIQWTQQKAKFFIYSQGKQQKSASNQDDLQKILRFQFSEYLYRDQESKLRYL